MKIEIEVPESVIRDCAIIAWRSSFAAPHYQTGVGGAGWEAVKAEVATQISKLDVSSLVGDAVKQFTPLVVRDIVQQELKKALKVAAASAAKSADLFQDTKPHED